ncbi:hypothetical protein C1T17_04225 [Sphingobium sp. SCG-1]|uniref:hypothetical protein n=1 Tax=Sphingobium sp. SCG-1 TaxID=2072936 RepID=UPI000CD68A75|nr:hypothetical protein [Sphingobium sp. SCG-1]AUW57425.1 hypothetical protein C1T17_04225 [Sphingobium sp. SCG-1]
MTARRSPDAHVDYGPPRYGHFRAASHWMLAGAVIAMLISGFLLVAPMAESDPAKVAVVGMHMIIGLTIALFC